MGRSMGRKLFTGLVLIGAAFIALLVVGAEFYTDLLWFSALGYASVFWKIIASKWAVKIGAGLLLSGFVFLNLMLTRPVIGQATWRLRDKVPGFLSSRWVGAAFLVAALVLGFSYSSSVSDSWEITLKYLNRTDFGRTDPLFGQDLGFYVFALDFYELWYTAALGIFLLTLIVVGAIYVLTRSFEVQGWKVSMLKRPKLHLSALLIGLLLIKAGGYLLSMYELLYSPRGVVFGAGYTDAVIQANGQKILFVLAIAAAVGVVFNLFRPGVVYILGSVVLLGLVSLLLGQVIPGSVQKFVVEPNELQKEKPYIQHNIAYTRYAYGLENVSEREFTATDRLSSEELSRMDGTLENIRLWDWRPLLQTYSQLQEIRLYYNFGEVDVDRYVIDGKYRQVMLSPREMEIEKIQNKTWINEHLQYTHGYGIVASPVNKVSPEGLPEFYVSDIPPRSTVPELSVSRPEIYYGEQTSQYVIVNTRSPEFDYLKGDENAFTTYSGHGGVRLSSPLVRAAFALRMGTSKLLLSSDLTSESRIMFRRDVKERVQAIAPFLRYDNDPYLVVAEDGRLFWILDAYTTTARMPYSQPVQGWGNYVRNSAKVTVDAYNGDVSFYLVDEHDPIIETYRKIFPDLFKPVSEMPEDLRRHLRYPEDLFKVQASIYTAYHMTSTTVFYNQEDLWTVPIEIYMEREQPVEPYYVIMELPGEDGPEEFVLMLPFTPREKNNMVAWMAARSDGDHYGELLVYKFPKDKLTFGPAQIEARIDQDPDISQLFTLWGQKGSSVLRGNLLVIPVKESILYVEPVYIQSEQSQMPELKKVIVGFGDAIVMEDTLEQALAKVFAMREGRTGPGPAAAADAVQPDRIQPRVPAEEAPPPAPGLPEGEIAGLAREARVLFESARQKAAAGDWAGYGEDLKRLEAVLLELEKAASPRDELGAP